MLQRLAELKPERTTLLESWLGTRRDRLGAYALSEAGGDDLDLLRRAAALPFMTCRSAFGRRASLTREN